MTPTKPPTGLFANVTAYGDVAFSRWMRRAFLLSAGYDDEDLDRPVVGIATTWSDYNTCHRDMPALTEAVRRGVLERGALPFVFPTASLHEILMAPTTMLYRNLLALETEELIRSQPMDAVVLLGGCDKTVPAQVLAATSVDVPALLLVTGPMALGSWHGERLGACTDCRRLWAASRAGRIDPAATGAVGGRLAASGGTCPVMGTASTMACLIEVLGLALPGSATPTSGTGERLRIGVQTGRRAAELALARHAGAEVPTTRSLLTRAALRNAVTALLALGGSTNAVIHLLAFARRAGAGLSLDDFDELARAVPLLVDCKPAGAGYLEDLHRAGGVPALLSTLRPLLDLTVRGVDGRTLGERLAELGEPGDWQTTLRPLARPLGPPGALVVLRGSLAPDGAILKQAAASPQLLQHRGPAVVFESPEDAARRIDDPALPVTPDSVLVLRNAGPAAAGMPEAGSLPIPKRLAQAGVTDLVRISDARMSGTGYGTVVLHVAPEAARGGPLALVRDGDLIELDTADRRLELCVPAEELQQRRAAWTPPPLPPRGWRRLYAEQVLQADQGADLAFLGPIPEQAREE